MDESNYAKLGIFARQSSADLLNAPSSIRSLSTNISATYLGMVKYFEVDWGDSMSDDPLEEEKHPKLYDCFLKLLDALGS